MTDALVDERTGIAGSCAVIVAIGSLVVTGGLALGVVRYLDPGSPPAARAMEGVWGGIALASVVAAPGVLVLLALHDRPALLLPAGIILVPLSFLSFAGVLLPLLVPAIVLFVAYGRRSAGRLPEPSWAALTTVVVVAVLLAAAISLFVHEDPRSYTTATGGGSTSDVITPVEALIALALVGGAIAIGWKSTGPRQ